MSAALFVSLPEPRRLDANDGNATKRPSTERALTGLSASLPVRHSAGAPVSSVSMRRATPVASSRRITNELRSSDGVKRRSVVVSKAYRPSRLSAAVAPASGGNANGSGRRSPSCGLTVDRSDVSKSRTSRRVPSELIPSGAPGTSIVSRFPVSSSRTTTDEFTSFGKPLTNRISPPSQNAQKRPSGVRMAVEQACGSWRVVVLVDSRRRNTPEDSEPSNPSVAGGNTISSSSPSSVSPTRTGAT
jgi:hypothetical protein